MGEERRLAGDPPILIDLRRSARARRMTLRVSSRDGRVTLTLPRRVKEREGLAFAEAKRGWLEKKLADFGERAPLAAGDEIPIEGAMRVIAVARVRAARIEDAEILVPTRYASTPALPIKALLKLLARDRLTAASDHYARTLGRSYTRLALRDTRSRWGSCSSSGTLSYSWRLAMAPPDVLSYVAAHEVAHLAEMNHSPAFWGTVARLMPGYEAPRRWLKEHGGELQRIVLDDPGGM